MAGPGAAHRWALERIDGKEMSDIREVTVGVMSEAEGHGQKNADNED